MNLVDVALVVSLVISVASGWQLGIIRGIVGFIGLVAGGWVGLQSTPVLVEAFSLSSGWRFVSGIGFVVACALLGQSGGFAIGSGIRRVFSWSPIRFLDSLLGVAFRATSWGLIVWLMASVIAFLPDRGLVHQVRTSQIVRTLDGYAPAAADRATAALRRVLRDTSFPQVFAALAPQPQNSVDPADRAVLADPDITATYPSVLQVLARSDVCATSSTGTGFIYARDRVMTNAHVVAGADGVWVRRDVDGRRITATVVYFNPDLDIAVLAVPDLGGRVLPFGEEQPYGSQGVVPGFTSGDPLSPAAARISELVIARGHDIYGVKRVDREIYILRSAIAPGDSGAPFVGDDGSVLGVVFAGSTDGSDSGYALTANAVAQAAATGRDATKAVGTGRCAE